ncbi:MAG TPA: TonB-dependent receptor [Steroidobacteraceae bacterium]|nr:TonB-dependent receptor [Steroidobacteraceae bacterium]
MKYQNLLCLGTGAACLAATCVMADTATSSASADVLTEVVVTAQRRTQNLQDVPIAIQVVSADMIGKLAADNFGDIGNFVPGLVVSSDSPTQPHYELRGIAGSDFGVGTDPAVGVYVDGVYAARSGASLLQFNDIERVEVLRGPQGTLLGRSSAAGAISVITKKPSDIDEGSIDVRVGNEGKKRVEAMLNTPVNDAMAFRFNLVVNHSDGFPVDAVTGKDLDPERSWAGRAAFRWDLSADTKLLLAWNHDSLDQLARPAIGLVPVPSAGSTPPILPPNPNFTGAGFLNAINAPIYNDLLQGNSESRTLNDFVVTLEHHFGDTVLQTTSDYRAFKTLNREDETGTDSIATYFDTANIEHNESWYQELKLSGKNHIADWVAGASYSYEHAEQTSQTNTYTDTVDTVLENIGLAGPGGLFGSTSAALAQAGVPINLLGLPWQESMIDNGRFKSLGVFGDVIWHLNDALNLTTGVRYSHDSKEFTWLAPGRVAPGLDAALAEMNNLGIFSVPGFPPQSTYNFNLIFPEGALQGVPYTANGSWSDVSPRVGLDYHFNPNTMVYVSVAKGFTPGGFDSVSINGQYSNETVWNYEAGVKATFPEARLQANAALYHYAYTNKQSLVLSSAANSVVPEYQVSTSDQEANGLDLELRWQPLSALSLGLTAAYIDSTYSKYESAALLGYWESQGQTPAQAAASANLTGQPTGEPLWSFAATADYVVPLHDRGNLDFWVGQSYRGATRCNAESQATFSCLPDVPFHYGKAENQTDARISWHSVKSHWGVSLYGTNLFDERYVTGIDTLTASTLGTPYALVNAPRRYGVDLHAGF